jgi:hypothetical protein
VIDPLPEGVYESLRTRRLNAALDQLVDLTPRFLPVEDADQPHVLARHIASAVERALADEPDPGQRRALGAGCLFAPCRTSTNRRTVDCGSSRSRVPTAPAGPHKEALARRVVMFAQVDDPERPAVFAQLADEPPSPDGDGSCTRPGQRAPREGVRSRVRSDPWSPRSLAYHQKSLTRASGSLTQRSDHLISLRLIGTGVEDPGG